MLLADCLHILQAASMEIFISLFYYESPRSQARRAQTDWVTFIKSGAQTSTKWTFVRVVYTRLRPFTRAEVFFCARKKLPHMIYVRQHQQPLPSS
ncbi:hypothetical protein SELSPUOL_02352 [Selenomonas sputigena ATCC 35185]|uniref:Uncharacterized protein n=1 Tax=Selenomonas sputigena (strain ATCC 35185 / DSM 20758 / CCUG 44933 / VPI D19B-28) TaxID=546271 RepID=C9LXZ3_SELS3|nr:hypothetical protein SELSPUOL_02352 [Selenomonas sputigena ATCC 35185]